jgi:hypothetical protein
MGHSIVIRVRRTFAATRHSDHCVQDHQQYFARITTRGYRDYINQCSNKTISLHSTGICVRHFDLVKILTAKIQWRKTGLFWAHNTSRVHYTHAMQRMVRKYIQHFSTFYLKVSQVQHNGCQSFIIVEQWESENALYIGTSADGSLTNSEIGLNNDIRC